MKDSKRSREKVKIGVMDVILIIVGILMLAFTLKMINVFEKQGAVPDTLITCFFALMGGECGIMGWIKTSKERHRARREESKDDEHPPAG